MRREVFYANLATIEAHNAGNHGWTMGLGEFTDLTSDEFQKARLSGYVPEPALRRRIAAIRTERVTAATGRSLRSSASLQAEAHLGAPVPGPVPSTSLDWTTTRNPKARVAVSAVQDQGSCVAGWAFAATGAIEGNGALFTAPTGAAPLLNLLAVQQMKGCASKSFACAGGRTQDGLQWAINNAGQCTAATYGPFSTANNTCMPASCQVAQSKIRSFTNCTTGNVPCMQAAVASKPVTVGVDGRSILLQHYTTGVINTTCTNNIEHVALVVGFGNWTNVARTPYWRIKNSWGNWWGDKGYFRVARGPSFDTMNGGFGVCGVYGIPMWPSY
jgi:cathepsin L